MGAVHDHANVWPLIRGKTAYLAGVNWVPVTARYRKNIKGMARRKGADKVATYFYQNQGAGREYVAGLINQADLGQSAQSVKEVYALALMVIPMLGRAGYAIINLAPDVYAFIGCVDGVLMNDVVGDKPAIEQAQNTFLQFNPEPETGWQRYAPPEFGLEGCSVFDLDSLLAAKKRPASARFQSVSAKKPLAGVIVLALVLCGSYYGYRLYADHQETLRLKAAHEAYLQAQQAAQQAATQVTAPWEDAPSVKSFVAACSVRWQAVPLSLAGWLFREAECAQVKGNQGRLRLAYTKPDGGTVGDFAFRVKRYFDGEYVPFFNVPGPGDLGGFTQPVDLLASRDSRPLPSADIQVQRMTTFAQQTRLQFTFTEENNRITNDVGVETLLPWRVYTMSLKTDIPPTLLFSGLDDTGVRLSAIKLSLEQGRLTYQIEGKFYAKQ